MKVDHVYLAIIFSLVLICVAMFGQKAAADDVDDLNNWGSQPIPEASPKMERRIFSGCAANAELTFYIAQEKLYQAGNAAAFDEYLHSNTSETEYRIMRKAMSNLAQWVDSHDYDTAKNYARGVFYECVQNSYNEFVLAPSQDAREYIYRFEALVESVREYPEDDAGA